ncbi:MAG: replication-associated recombination protein A [Bacteroidales bacterium]|nr:replication-associated recombination protein A [Bacteroidales bacterium]
MPLADLLRPQNLNDFIGQKHLVGEGSVLRKSVVSGHIPSMIFWGPPGCGKTSLALIIAKSLNKEFYTLSAVSSGVKDVREVIDKAVGAPVLFIDEIHRFSKSQQDSLLGAVEKGNITLIGATTENPSFEVIAPLLSRCQVYILKSFEEENLNKFIEKARVFLAAEQNITITVNEKEALYRISGGDARKLLNAIELTVSVNSTESNKEIIITDKLVLESVQQNLALYDKMGEMHYDIISAFIKSMRGSDPNAAVYWLGRMLEAGEDPKFIARRMLILASEDIGNANPNALLLANSCFQAVAVIGYPECGLILSQTAIYLAGSPKSNASYMALNNVFRTIKQHPDLSVPLHLRNAPTKLMKKLNYGKDYKYAHDFENNFALQNFLPEALKGQIFYKPGNNARETEILNRLKQLWKGHYNY